MPNSTDEALLRLEIFAELEMLADSKGGLLATSDLREFWIRGFRLPLIDTRRGIRNPTVFSSTLSIVSAADGPYEDRVGSDGLLLYKFRTGDPLGGDNRKLRNAMTSNTPIILFEKPVAGVYVPVVPVYVIGEDLVAGHFVLDTSGSITSPLTEPRDTAIDKRYVEQTVRRRVHQPVFRAKVLVAYSSECAICQLKHPELLDAAHIIGDSHIDGVAHVTNGMALCKIHHAAYDRNLIGVSPDYKVHVNGLVLQEVDGPMLRHGIQDMHGLSISVPKRFSERPSPELLSTRFADFIP